MTVTWKITPFKDLTIDELYQVLQLRSEVFVVEQNCVYQDIDGKDTKALHLIGLFNGEVVAYTRLFDAGIYFDNASLGRVVISPKLREQKLGHEMIHKAIIGIEENFHTSAITISAQLYLERFYQKHGFESVGESYLEDDIPHIEMIKK
ncbi:GNAT family N-acetyltransferase [Flavobacterium sp. '19STA2R22 D10 B1']|uniref:GNAT family N-acetyltransferase n=1 Tax=Flavobacterium aerium TaxID=3037261 RepID=UPI00278C10AA|nr:GNAT family N-acetyltransferase [Flavobacterium sp. '19STA2R22 D10 B1']